MEGRRHVQATSFTIINLGRREDETSLRIVGAAGLRQWSDSNYTRRPSLDELGFEGPMLEASTVLNKQNNVQVGTGSFTGSSKCMLA
jgi:hypothetical protein